MNIHIIGARALNPIASTKVRKHASVRFCVGKSCLQIDVGNPWRGKADFLIISHLHQDHIGKIRTVPISTSIYVPHHSFEKYISKRSKANVRIFSAQKSTRIGPFTVTAFPVQHSQYTKTFGYRISAQGKTIAWLPDFRNLRGCIKHFRRLDTLFIGASCWKRHITHRDHERRGHMAILSTLRTLRQQNIHPKKIRLMHLGKQLTPLKEKIKLLQEKFPEFDLDVVVDNQNIRI